MCLNVTSGCFSWLKLTCTQGDSLLFSCPSAPCTVGPMWVLSAHNGAKVGHKLGAISVLWLWIGTRQNKCSALTGPKWNTCLVKYKICYPMCHLCYSLLILSSFFFFPQTSQHTWTCHGGDIYDWTHCIYRCGDKTRVYGFCSRTNTSWIDINWIGHLKSK